MTSKEALKRIETMFPFNKEYKSNYYAQFSSSIEPFYKDFNLIKQDLDKLEELEKENSYLQVQNKTLREMVEIDKQINIHTFELIKENIKLKKALDILIRKLDTRLTKTENYDTAETYYSVYNENSCEVLYPEEYELLKEVLGNGC